MTEAQKYTVVIAHDGSDHADYSFHWYMEHLHKPSHYVVLLHVPERNAFMAGPLGGAADVESIKAIMAEEDAKEKVFLERLGKKLKDTGIGGKVKSVAGKPGEVIVQVADEENALFIVSGTRGHGVLRRTLMGSVSDYILHHSHVPVFICRHRDLHVHKDGVSPKGSPSLLRRFSPFHSPKGSPQSRRKHTLSSSN